MCHIDDISIVGIIIESHPKQFPYENQYSPAYKVMWLNPPKSSVFGFPNPEVLWEEELNIV